MDPDRFEAWSQQSVRAYAEENVKSGRWDDSEAMERSEREFMEQLPDGLATPDHFMFELFFESEYIGYIWVFINPGAAVPSAFIYDIEIVAEQRGKGFGKATMRALEPWCKALNLKRIALNVFAFNTTAIELYQGMGYQTTNFSMQKDI